MKTTYGASPYSVTKDLKVVRLRPPAKRTYSIDVAPIGEDPIEKLIYRYGILTEPLLQRLLVLRNDKRIEAGPSLRILSEQGKVIRYQVEHEDEDVKDLIIYRLAKRVERTFEEKKRPRPAYRFEMADMASVMGHLTTIQWHIAMLESGAKEIMFHGSVQGEKELQFIPVPSLTRYKVKGKISTAFCAIPAPRGSLKRDLGAFLINVTEISRYFQRSAKKFRTYVIVVLVSSEDQIEEISKVMAQVTETRECLVLYSLDITTFQKDTNPLMLLYDVNRTDGVTSEKLVNLS